MQKNGMIITKGNSIARPTASGRTLDKAAIIAKEYQVYHATAIVLRQDPYQPEQIN